MVPLNDFSIVRCTEVISALKIKHLYSAPRPALEVQIHMNLTTDFQGLRFCLETTCSFFVSFFPSVFPFMCLRAFIFAYFSVLKSKASYIRVIMCVCDHAFF